MNSYQKYTRDVIIIGISNIVIGLRGLILLPIISKTLGASGYGVWAQVTVTLFLISCFSTLNLPASLSRFLAAEKDREIVREGFFTVLITGLASSLVFTFILLLTGRPVAETLFHDPGLEQIITITAIIIPFWAIEVICLDLFRAFQEMRSYAFVLIARNLAELALIAYLVLTGRGIFGAVIALLIARVAVDIIMLPMIIRRIGVKWPDFSQLRPYLSFAVPMIPGLLSLWVTTSSDRYIISVLLGTTPVGIYSAGYSLGHTIVYFIAPLTFVMLPALSRLYDENKATEVKTHLTYSLKYLLMLAIPSVFGLSVLARPLLNILTTPEFVPTGTLVVPIVSASYLLFGVYVIYSQVFTLAKKTRVIGILWVSAALLNLALNITFVPRFGVLAAAFTTLVSYAFVLGTTILLSAKLIKFSVDWTFILKSIIASAAMSLVIWILNPAGIARVALAIGLGVIIYFVILFLERGFSSNEIGFFRRLLRRD